MTSDNPTRRLDSESNDAAVNDAAVTEPSSHHGSMPETPQAIGRYQIERKIGQGGFGTVYLARDERLDRQVAIKVPHLHLFASSDAAEAYLAEARTVAKLEHPHIVPVYDFGASNQYPCYIVMKYIDGMNLAAKLSRSPFGFSAAARLIGDIARALHHAHRNGVVHRDLKPGNILIDRQGVPCVVDFGLALREQDVGKVSRFAGTATYMSPEQARGEGHRVDGRADIYSLGAVFYEMLTGRRTVSAVAQAEILEQVKFQEAKPPRQINDSVPRELERICLRALAKRASDRYTTALDMAEELDAFLESESASSKSSATSVVSVADSNPSTQATDSTTVKTKVPSESSSQAISVVPKGLRSFESHDAEFFLSLLPGPRDRDGVPECVRFWIQRLQSLEGDQTFPVGVLYGPSGCGKSSLLKAGILPRLGANVHSIFMEASAVNTEVRLASLVRERFGDPDDRMRLPALIAKLRRGGGAASDRKVVIVLDQFEQWLHGHSSIEHSELVQALRQCDGRHVQCLLLVRDDFWLNLSRLMRALETPLIEGKNTAMVDLFDQEHAQRVLAAFGRAFGRLPRASEMSTDQRQFLETAIEMLSEDGRVISVRLALFAEMMKSRKWTPGSLNALGGTTGLGVDFLEQTFSSASAPPAHRFHQHAASKVLQAMLPRVGIDIRGEMQSYAALMEVSGYQDCPQDFEDLMRILDTDVRLIAPTVSLDPTPQNRNASEVRDAHDDDAAAGVSGRSNENKYYQLTHDYLVRSLREWLTRKQKSTRQGRAELLLAERAAMWSGTRESRLLPSFWEWMRIRVFTRARERTLDQQQMMRQTDRYLGVRALVMAAIVPLVLLAGWEFRGRSRSNVLIETLTHAPTKEVPEIISHMTGFRRWVDRDLRQRITAPDSQQNPRRELHVRLAMLPSDASQLEWIVEHALESTPEELTAIRSLLVPYANDVSAQLWSTVENDRDPERKLRAACLLATLSTKSTRLGDSIDDVVTQLTFENPSVLNAWVSLLNPIGEVLLPAISDQISQTNDASELRTLSELYSEFAGTSPIGFGPLRGTLAECLEQGDEKNVEDARRQANLGTALAIGSEWKSVLPMLQSAPNPARRSYLISFLSANYALPADLEHQLAPSTNDAFIRQALVLILGGMPENRRSISERERFEPVLIEMLRSEPDPGVKNAIRWTIDRWNAARQEVADNRSRSKFPEMTIIRPGKLLIETEGSLTRTLQVDHAFAIANTEVTFADFLKFRADQFWDRRAAPTADCPVHEVSWYDAAAYCNWLSEQDGLPEEQFCYAPNSDGEYASGMIVKGSALQLSGFRLATVAEWEYACRSSATTYWSMGNCVELLDQYAWSMTNSGIHSHPVASLMPNGFGLFDMHGNVWEWCHDRTDEQGKRIEVTDSMVVNDDDLFALCGGTYITDPEFLGCASMNWNRADKRTNADGFRVVRTVTQ